MRFIISVWNQFASDGEFENTIPLEFNGRRLAQLGERNAIDVLVLEGFERFSEGYRGRLRELGYTLHDCRALVREQTAKIPLFVQKYREWGGIKHYGMLRFLIIPRVFPNDDVISIDGDMVFNAGLREIEAAVGRDLYFLDRSTCLSSIPAGSDFFDIFKEHLLRANANADAYAREVMKLRDAGDFLDPIRFGGTDQAFLRHLQRAGFIDFRSDQPNDDLLAFGNWLRIDDLGLAPHVYERRGIVDYVDGRKVMISHISNDVWIYFWQPMMLSRLFGRDNLSAFGRLPHPYQAYGQRQESIALKGFLGAMHEAFRLNLAAIPPGLNHFSRGEVIRHYYLESDLSEILNDRMWYKPGVFA